MVYFRGGMILLSVHLIIVALMGYALGCLTFGLIVSSVFNLRDPREYGSGNIGATNLFRGGSPFFAALTLLGDVLKSVLAVYLTKIFWPEIIYAPYIAAIAAFYGHLYPVNLGFKGGKGVATAFGGLLTLNPIVAFMALAVWLLVFAIGRISSLSALVTALLTTIISFFYSHSLPFKVVVCLMCISLVISHRDNIKSLLACKES